MFAPLLPAAIRCAFRAMRLRRIRPKILILIGPRALGLEQFAFGPDNGRNHRNSKGFDDILT